MKKIFLSFILLTISLLAEDNTKKGVLITEFEKENITNQNAVNEFDTKIFPHLANILISYLSDTDYKNFTIIDKSVKYYKNLENEYEVSYYDDQSIISNANINATINYIMINKISKNELDEYILISKMIDNSNGKIYLIQYVKLEDYTAFMSDPNNLMTNIKNLADKISSKLAQ